MVERQNRVISHYHQDDLTTRVLAAVRALRGTLDGLRPDELAPVDGFHVRGLRATAELAELAAVQPGQQVLDVGSGPGGAARYLAAERGCEVVGVDLTPAYVALAAELSRHVGLAKATRFVVGSATALPFAAAAFDLVWLEHVQMNIADKAGLLGELARVLKPGGRLALHEVCCAGASQPHFPVPWAASEPTSFLVPSGGLRGLLQDHGFVVTQWRDVTEVACTWFRKRREAGAAAPSPLGLHLLMGPDTRAKITNLSRSLEEGRVCLVQVVAERQG